MLSPDKQKIEQLNAWLHSADKTAAISRAIHSTRTSLSCSDICDSLPVPDRRGMHNKKWFLPTKKVTFPAEYIEALTEIALEWQETKLASK